MVQAAVIIPHYNDTVRLEKCLTALMPQAAGRPVEVAVIDNGSTEDLGPLKARFDGVLWLDEADKGAAPARNTGVAATTAPRLFFIDADCIPAPDWLETALGLEATDGMIGGRVDVFDETPPPRSGAEAFETVFAFPQEMYVRTKGFSVTANLLSTRAVFEAVGPFDKRVVEDSDWCQRAGRMGYPIRYEDRLVVAHPTRQDWAALRRKWYRTNNENYFANGTGALDRLRWGARGVAVMLSGPVHVPRVLGHGALSGLEKRRAVRTLLGLRLARGLWMLRQMIFGDTRI
ncbi:MAG: glycosyltransferase [Pseudomonadota bacterium]